MSEQRILSFSGRKGSGKNTGCNFLAGMELSSLGIIQKAFMVGTETEGKLWVSDLFGDLECEGILDLQRRNPQFDAFAAEHIFPYVKIYSFADLLKEEVCMKILGLTREQCFGTDDEKNSITHLMWEDMPGILPETNWDNPYAVQFYSNGGENDVLDTLCSLGLQFHTKGPMTAREVMQYVGTDIFRKMYGNVWVDATIRKIKEENSLLALVCDCRFPNEVEGILDAGGKVIRFTRDVFAGQDVHASETALDRDKFDWSRFSAVVDNQEMTINEQNLATTKVLKEWGWDWCNTENLILD